MDLHLPLDRTRPLREQIERELRGAIRSGTLRAGSKLPPTRTLAAELNVSRGVLVEAYSQLTAEGYLVARRRDGTRVAAGLAQTTAPCRPRPAELPRVRYDLRTGVPDVSLFPRAAWAKAASTAARRLPDAAFRYGPAEGLPALRRALVEYLGRVRAVVADESHMFVTCGSSHAMSVLWSVLARRGVRTVAIEDPSWTRIHTSLRAARLEVCSVGVDASGLRVETIPDGVDAVVVSPAHQYPTGALLAARRRTRLLAWAARTGGLIIEDDYDAEYRYDGQPMAPLQSMAPDRVVYLGTSSKTLAPGLRLGWLVAPDDLTPQLAERFSISHALPSVIAQATYADLLGSGAIDRHLRFTRREYRARRSTLVAALAEHVPDARVVGASAGLHLMLTLGDGHDERAITARAAARGITIDALHRDFHATLPAPEALVLGYGAIPAPAIGRAVRELAACIETPHARRAAA